MDKFFEIKEFEIRGEKFCIVVVLYFYFERFVDEIFF